MAMAAQMGTSHGSIHAEALTFALARQIPRPDAERQVKSLLAEAVATGQPLATLATRDHPALDWSAIIATSLGQAPNEALSFAQAVSGSGGPPTN
jgi:3-carboxy-cis,cis-muconate cycloisomerase